MDVEQTVQRRRDALRILERAAKGEGFAQLFADTSALAKDRESSFEDQLQGFYGLLSDLLELTSRAKQPLLRNPHLSKELEALSKIVDSPWVMRAIAGFDELHVGSRRNLNRQLGLDALAASLAPNSQREVWFPSVIIDCSKRANRVTRRFLVATVTRFGAHASYERNHPNL